MQVSRVKEVVGTQVALLPVWAAPADSRRGAAGLGSHAGPRRANNRVLFAQPLSSEEFKAPHPINTRAVGGQYQQSNSGKLRPGGTAWSFL